MKKLIFLFVFIILSSLAFSQCMVENWSLEKRVQLSTLVVEGRIISQESEWDKHHALIYTKSKIDVYKVFKGSVESKTITLITPGGTVGLDKLSVSPSLQVEQGSVGVFLLVDAESILAENLKTYKPTASVQSYIKYTEYDSKAYDNLKVYNSIIGELYPTISHFSNENIKELKHYNPSASKTKIRALAPPIITSFDVDTITAGTGSLLTISGSNFGIARGKGKVGFRDANSGDSTLYFPPLKTYYESWSNSAIKVYVPSRAGTGTIRVFNNLGEYGTSADTLTISWSHSNVFFAFGNDTSAYQIDHINDNAAGGYTWQMTPDFEANGDAVRSFTRSLEEWRCETKMNWIVGPSSPA